MERTELKAVLRATGSAVESGNFVFLCDPAWGQAERARFEALRAKAADIAADANGDGWLCIPTGGSSGRLRFARHDEHTFTAAVLGFCAHLNVKKINVVGVLPTYHVSGLMARVRSAATGGEYVDWTWKRIESLDMPALNPAAGDWFISLVPTQLQRLLPMPAAVEWLRRFRAVFIGGGPIWPSLADEAARVGVPVSLSYGMTETAAMIAALQPDEFLAGARSSGAVMPHAKIEIVDEENGSILEPGRSGLVRIAGASLFRGYFPDRRAEGESFSPEDIGVLDTAGRLSIIGRRDAVIITGGKKVHPGEVEDALRASGEFSDVAVLGLPDEIWGQIVVACHPGPAKPVDSAKVEAALASLAFYKRPKRIIQINTWPRSAQGKVNRAALQPVAISAGLNPGE